MFRRQQPVSCDEVCFLSATRQPVIGPNADEAAGSPVYRRPSRNEEITDEKLIPAGQASNPGGQGAGGQVTRCDTEVLASMTLTVYNCNLQTAVATAERCFSLMLRIIDICHEKNVCWCTEHVSATACNH